MKIILIENIKNLGKRGDIKEVSNGYAQNFLFPQKLAVPATAENIEEAKKANAEIEEKNRQKTEGIGKVIAQIKNRDIIIKRREKNKKLFGSIVAKDIALELNKISPKIEENMVILPRPIKNLGRYEIELRFRGGLKTHFNLTVLGE